MGDGHSADGWLVGGSVKLLLQVYSPLFGQWVAANCAAPPNASAGPCPGFVCKNLAIYKCWKTLAFSANLIK